MESSVSSDLLRVKELVNGAKDILILTHANPTGDSMGSALALYLGLKSLNKQVVVACPTPMTVEFSNFVGANKLETKFSKKNFVISLDYEDGSIDKVTYNIEDKKFNLIIEPRPGYEGFSQEHVSFRHKGTAADIIFVVDTKHLGELGEFYENEKELFATHPIINIDAHPANTRFGAVNLVDHASSTAELVALVLSATEAVLNEDIATNILNALYMQTNSFQNEITARAFEVAAVCMKAGGKRFSSIEIHQEKEEQVCEEKAVEIQPDAEPTKTVEETAPQLPTNPPEDWLKPKIFKSSTIA